MSFLNLITKIKYPIKCDLKIQKQLHLSALNNGLFYEKDMKAGYKTNEEIKNTSKTTLIRNGLKELRNEIELWKNEVKEKFEMDPTVINRPGETDVVWRLNSKEALSKFVTTCDSDHSEGFSTCSLDLTPHGKAIFSGELNTRVPKDGRVQRSGYCNMRSQRARKSFKRDSYYDWTGYNMLVMKVRGDGRSYVLNLSATGYFDVMWNDVYHYILFTRGGPYWQIAKVIIL